MGDQREYQSDWRKQTIYYWERPNAKSWITVQKTPEENVMSVESDQSAAEATEVEDSLDHWQTYVSKQFENFFNRVGKIKNYRVHADFFETLTPIQQKGRRVPITLQDKVDKAIDKLYDKDTLES